MYFYIAHLILHWCCYQETWRDWKLEKYIKWNDLPPQKTTIKLNFIENKTDFNKTHIILNRKKRIVITTLRYYIQFHSRYFKRRELNERICIQNEKYKTSFNAHLKTCLQQTLIQLFSTWRKKISLTTVQIQMV